MIVDDKKIDRDGICFLLRQNGYPLEPATAANGSEALDCLMSDSFDILMTDISMPKMSGLELIRRALELQPDLKCIVFSAYSDFKYAQTAIDMGIVSYLLKPIKIDDFKSCFDKTIEAIRHDRKKSSSFVLHEILYNRSYNDREGTISSGYVFEFDFTQPHYSRFPGPDFPDNFISVFLNEYQCVVIAPDEASAEAYITDMRKMSGDSDSVFLITCGGQFSNTAELKALFDAIEDYSVVKFYIRQNEVIHLDDTEICSDIGDIRQLFGNLSLILKQTLHCELDEADRLLTELFAKLEVKRNIEIAVVKSACSEFARRVLLNSDNLNDYYVDYISRISVSSNISELKDIILSMIHLRSGRSIDTVAIQNAINIIEKDYMTDLRLENVSASVFLSPCYFSSLFKKTTGINFLKYLTSYRMEKAKELLSSTLLTINEISEQTGYPNCSYFCHNFRNYCGLSPKQYREKEKINV